MIQRIQSIFLMLASGASFSMFLPQMSFFSVDNTQEMQGISNSSLADGVFNIHDNIIMIVMVVLAGILALASIFLYANRHRQMAFARILIVLSIVMAAIIGILFYQDYQRMQSAQYLITVEFGVLAPLAVLFFGVLALVYIRKDENLVRSMDRLR